MNYSQAAARCGRLQSKLNSLGQILFTNNLPKYPGSARCMPCHFLLGKQPTYRLIRICIKAHLDLYPRIDNAEHNYVFPCGKGDSFLVVNKIHLRMDWKQGTRTRVNLSVGAANFGPFGSFHDT